MKSNTLKKAISLLSIILVMSFKGYSQCPPCVPVSTTKYITVPFGSPTDCWVSVKYIEITCPPGLPAISIAEVVMFGNCDPNVITQQAIVQAMLVAGISVTSTFTAQYEAACKAYAKIEFNPAITCWTVGSVEGPPVPPSSFTISDAWKSIDCSCVNCCQEDWRFDGIKWYNLTGAGEVNCTLCSPNLPVNNTIQCFDQLGNLVTHTGLVTQMTNCKSMCDATDLAMKTDASSAILKMNDVELAFTPRVFKNNINFSSIDKIAKIEIVDANGKLIKEISKLTSNELDLSYISAGIIFVKITLKEGIYNTIKLIKE